MEDPASWVRRRRRCYGKETPLQGWRSLLLEAGLRVRGSPSSPLFRVADRVCERGAAAGGEAVKADGASVVFAPVVGSGGWPCC